MWKKKLDKSHCIKNNVKQLFDLRNKKEVSITNQVIQHLHKCINYIFSKNIGDVEKYSHRSQPYKTPLSDAFLREKLNVLFVPIIAKQALYIDLGSCCYAQCPQTLAIWRERKPLFLEFRQQLQPTQLHGNRGLDLVWHWSVRQYCEKALHECS